MAWLGDLGRKMAGNRKHGNARARIATQQPTRDTPHHPASYLNRSLRPLRPPIKRAIQTAHPCPIFLSTRSIDAGALRFWKKESCSCIRPSLTHYRYLPFPASAIDPPRRGSLRTAKGLPHTTCDTALYPSIYKTAVYLRWTIST